MLLYSLCAIYFCPVKWRQVAPEQISQLLHWSYLERVLYPWGFYWLQLGIFRVFPLTHGCDGQLALLTSSPTPQSPQHCCENTWGANSLKSLTQNTKRISNARSRATHKFLHVQQLNYCLKCSKNTKCNKIGFSSAVCRLMLAFQVTLWLQILFWLYKTCVTTKQEINLNLCRQTFPNRTVRPKINNHFFVIEIS